MTLAWTEVPDGTGAPASYRLKYAQTPIDWSTAAIGCQQAMLGRRISARMTCTVTGLTATTDYDFQLESFRSANSVLQGAQYSNVASVRTAPPLAEAVSDLAVQTSTSSAVTLRWTQVDDGAGDPASYRVKYATAPLSWSTGSVGCDPTLQGTEVGAPMSCSVEGLDPGTKYDFQISSFREMDRVWEGAAYSGVVSATTTVPTAEPAGGGRVGIWQDHAELMRQPTSGAAWERILADAGRDHGAPNIADQNSNHDVLTLAAALACVRAGQFCEKARAGVVRAIGTEAGARWLAVGRNLAGYVIAADLLNLRSDGVPGSDGDRVQRWIQSWLTKKVLDNNTTALRPAHPFGTGANASAQEGLVYTAVAAYLGDRQALERAWNAFRTFACDPGAPNTEGIDLVRPVEDGWTHDDRTPCAVNPAGARKTVSSGRPGAGGTFRIDGALVGDMRRGGAFQWKPGFTSYPWVGLEGFVPAAVILHRAGYPAFQIANRAVLRTHEYLWTLRNATGEPRWFDGVRAREVIHLVNVVYGASFPVEDVAGIGRTVGYTTWTHAKW